MRLGIELDVGVVRAVRLPGRRGATIQVMETAWDPDHPEVAVQSLREGLGTATYVSVAIGLPLLLVKRVKLPPVSAEDRAAILQLEPQRFFAVRLEELVAAVGDDDDLVFAAREAPLTQWLAALSSLGRVDRVEPSPLALARALGEERVGDVVVVQDRAERGAGVGLVEIRGGRVSQARRVYGKLSDAAAALEGNGGSTLDTLMITPWSTEGVRELAAHLPAVKVAELPSVGGVSGPFLAAYGAARGANRSLAGVLMPEGLRAGIKRRRLRELWFAGLTCLAAGAFALASFSAWTERSGREIELGIQALNQRATEALALQGQLETLNRQAGTIVRASADRVDPLAVLLALSKRLPAGAYLRSMRTAGEEWQVDGHASQAAQLIQVLGAAPEFRGVHFLSATNRVQVGERSYESFSIAFRFVPTP